MLFIVIQMIMIFISASTPNFISIGMIAIIIATGEKIDTPRVYLIISLGNIILYPLRLFAGAINIILASRISLDRISKVVDFEPKKKRLTHDPSLDEKDVSI